MRSSLTSHQLLRTLVVGPICDRPKAEVDGVRGSAEARKAFFGSCLNSVSFLQIYWYLLCVWENILSRFFPTTRRTHHKSWKRIERKKKYSNYKTSKPPKFLLILCCEVTTSLPVGGATSVEFRVHNLRGLLNSERAQYS